MSKKTLSATLGSTLVASLTLAPLAHASENPFAVQAIAGPQHLAAAETKAKEGKCGEGKCGAGKMKESGSQSGKMKEGGCSGSKMKEGGCSGSMKGDATQQPKE